MTQYSAIDLSQLKKPSVLEELSADEIRIRLLNRFAEECEAKGFDFYSLVESDPAVIILNSAVQEILLDRAQRNDEVCAMLLAYAEDADLDHLAAEKNIIRKPGETDKELKTRVQLCFEQLTSCGTQAAYEFHAREVDGVLDAKARSPEQGKVLVSLLVRDGFDQDEVLSTARTYLLGEDIRQLTDHVTVQLAERVEYRVKAELTFYPGPSTQPLLERAREQLEARVTALSKLDHDIALSTIYAQLHIEGVQNVRLIEPQADIVIGAHQAAHCVDIVVSEAEQRDI